LAVGFKVTTSFFLSSSSSFSFLFSFFSFFSSLSLSLNSLFSYSYPVGHYVRQLGPIGELETEIQSLLVENDVQVGSFAENMTADLPPWPSVERPWQVPASEIPLRKDLRQSHRIFSIDPLGSQDIDDALSARKLPNDSTSNVGSESSALTSFSV
jgi:DIS3-like exonuclease 1